MNKVLQLSDFIKSQLEPVLSQQEQNEFERIEEYLIQHLEDSNKSFPHNKLKIRLSAQKADQLLRWMAFKGYSNTGLIHNKLLDITVDGAQYDNSEFIIYMERMALRRYGFSPMYINMGKLPKELRMFLRALKFDEINPGHYQFQTEKNYFFDMSGFRKAMGYQTTQVLKFLDENCYIFSNDAFWRRDRITADAVKFKLSSKFFLHLMATEPKKNDFEDFIVDVFDEIFSIDTQQYQKVA